MHDARLQVDCKVDGWRWIVEFLHAVKPTMLSLSRLLLHVYSISAATVASSCSGALRSSAELCRGGFWPPSPICGQRARHMAETNVVLALQEVFAFTCRIAEFMESSMHPRFCGPS